jgi:hypothetical protein
MWQEFRDRCRDRRKPYAIRHKPANSRSKTCGFSIILLGLADALVDDLILCGREIDVRRSATVKCGG